MTDIIIQLFTAFLGAFGFAILFQIGKDKLFVASLGGLITKTCYVILVFFLQGDLINYYLSSAIITLYAEYMARKYKSPATVFLVPATIPLIPGGSLYQTMTYGLRQEWQLFIKQGISTLLMAVAISCGILTTMTIIKMYYKVKNKINN